MKLSSCILFSNVFHRIKVVTISDMEKISMKKELDRWCTYN